MFCTVSVSFPRTCDWLNGQAVIFDAAFKLQQIHAQSPGVMV